MQLLHQNSLQHGNDLHLSSMVNHADLRHYQTHQQRQPLERQPTLTLLQEEGASGFLSGAELAGLRGALQGLDRSTASKLYMSYAPDC